MPNDRGATGFYKKIAKKMTNLGQKGLRNYGEPFPPVFLINGG